MSLLFRRSPIHSQAPHFGIPLQRIALRYFVANIDDRPGLSANQCCEQGVGRTSVRSTDPRTTHGYISKEAATFLSGPLLYLNARSSRRSRTLYRSSWHSEAKRSIASTTAMLITQDGGVGDGSEESKGYWRKWFEENLTEEQKEEPADGVYSGSEGSEEEYESELEGEDYETDSEEELEDEEIEDQIDEVLGDSPMLDFPESDSEEEEKEYHFRPDRSYFPGTQYDTEEFDLSKPLKPVWRQPREKKAFSVQEVIQKADFRNVRFLTQFTGDTGNILARKQFKMRAKSQRRIIKAIKTARFFGLMPYTNMGRPRYVFGQPYDSEEDFYSGEEGDYEDEDEGEGTNEAGYQGEGDNNGEYQGELSEQVKFKGQVT